MTKTTYQIHISLKGSKPKIWRRILVPSDLLLYDFHDIIQITMGWSDSHLFQFKKNKTYYAADVEEEEFWGNIKIVDCEGIKISDLLKKEKDKIIYEYDFGDSWIHDIVLEKITDNIPNKKIPICLAGKNNCPPEDCGGIWAYNEMIKVLSNPEHEEYEEYIEWFGEEFDPEYFNKKEINEML